MVYVDDWRLSYAAAKHMLREAARGCGRSSRLVGLPAAHEGCEVRVNQCGVGDLGVLTGVCVRSPEGAAAECVRAHTRSGGARHACKLRAKAVDAHSMRCCLSAGAKSRGRESPVGARAHSRGGDGCVETEAAPFGWIEECRVQRGPPLPGQRRAAGVHHCHAGSLQRAHAALLLRYTGGARGPLQPAIWLCSPLSCAPRHETSLERAMRRLHLCHAFSFPSSPAVSAQRSSIPCLSVAVLRRALAALRWQWPSKKAEAVGSDVVSMQVLCLGTHAHSDGRARARAARQKLEKKCTRATPCSSESPHPARTRKPAAVKGSRFEKGVSSFVSSGGAWTRGASAKRRAIGSASVLAQRPTPTCFCLYKPTNKTLTHDVYYGGCPG